MVPVVWDSSRASLRCIRLRNQALVVLRARIVPMGESLHRQPLWICGNLAAGMPGTGRGAPPRDFCGRPLRRLPDSAPRRPGVHRPGKSTAPADAALRPDTRWVLAAPPAARVLMRPAPRRRLRPACARRGPNAAARGCRTSSTPRSPARPRTRRPVREDTPPRTSATATAAR